MSKLTCYGGAGSTTGANFLLEISGKKILIDCGMKQGVNASEHNAQKFPYDPSKIDFLFVTHAHIDHIGLIPKLFVEGFRGKIFSTPETRSIAILLLLDAAKIAGEDEVPLYTPADVESVLTLWQTLPYHKKEDFDGFSIELYDAGHVLGSSMVELTTSLGKMLFSGDIGNSPSPLLPDVEKVSGLDYLLMESVYGDKNHEPKDLRDEKFERVVRDSIERGGSLLIPAFSLERTQMLLYRLNNLFEEKKIPSVPVYLDSPLAIRITKIYEGVKDLYNREAEDDAKKGDGIFKFPKLKETAAVADSQEIANTAGPKIIIAGSGMSTAGRILYHEERFLPDPNSTILLVGFQALGTLGRQIEEGMKKIKINSHQVEVRARVEKINGFSAHADSDALVDFVEPSAKKLKKVFVAMGEPGAQIFLAQRLRDEFGVDAVTTEPNKTYELDL